MSRSNGLPSVWAIMIAFVFGEMASSRRCGKASRVLRSTSTTTGFNPF